MENFTNLLTGWITSALGSDGGAGPSGMTALSASGSTPTSMSSTPGSLEALRQELINRAPNADWSAGGVDRAAELAQILYSKGITDLSKLSLGQYGGTAPKLEDYLGKDTGGDNGHTMSGGEAQAAYEQDLAAFNAQKVLKYGDKSFGTLTNDLPYLENNNLAAWSAEGHGNVGYNTSVGPDGQLVIAPNWGSSSDWGVARDLGTKALVGAAMIGTAGAAGGLAATGAGVGESVSGAYAGLTAADSLAAAGTGAGVGSGAGVGESVSGMFAGPTGEAVSGTYAGMPAAAAGGAGTALPGAIAKSAPGFFESLGLPSWVDKGAGIASNLYGLYEANQIRKTSDPFAKYRDAYGNQLAALEANPSSITSRPGYQAGLEAVQRGAAAGGYLGSGNEQVALAKYGGDFYTQEANRLATLAGAGATPGAGQVPAAVLAGNALAGFGYTPPYYPPMYRRG